MEQLIWVIFLIILGLLLGAFSHIAIPSYLAVKTIKVLSLSSLDDSQLSRLHWYDFVLGIMILVPLVLLLIHFGVDIFFEIPTWAPWVPERLHHMFHRIQYPIPIAAFVARIISILYFGKRSQKKSKK